MAARPALRLLSALLLLLPAPAARPDERGLAESKLLLMRKLDAVQISALDDFLFPAGVVGPQPQEDAVCIHATGDGRYRILASSGNGSGEAFRLASGSAHIRYRTTWIAADGGGTDLVNGQISIAFSGGHKTSRNCGGSTNARLRIAIDSTSFDTAPPGLYTDTLTLTLSPN